MGRIGVSYGEVAKTAAELQGEGFNPTVDAVRERLKTGSRSTIGPYLKQWRCKQEENNENAGGLPQELYSLTKGLYNKLQETAEARITLAENAAQAEVTSIQEKLNQSNAQNAVLEKEIQSLSTKIFDLTSMNNKLEEELDNEQKINLTLSAKNQELETRIEDKILQMQLLEKQLDHVQANLEHYRESMNIQRETDKYTWEREAAQFNQGIKELKHQVLESNKSNQLLNQKLETMQIEKTLIEKDWYEQRGKTMELQEQLKIKDYIAKDLEDKYNERTIDYQSLGKQFKQNQISFSQLEKENLILQERLKITENLVRRAEDTIANLHNERLFLTQEITSLKNKVKKLEDSLH